MVIKIIGKIEVIMFVGVVKGNIVVLGGGGVLSKSGRVPYLGGGGSMIVRDPNFQKKSRL